MYTHSSRSLLAAILTLGLSLLTSTDVSVSGSLTPLASPGLCASVPEQRPTSGGAPGHLTGISAAAERSPAATITGLLGVLGQMIVEAELSHAAISGHFEPEIHATVAGSEFVLEVCRDTIVGEVSVAQQPGVQFVIGDFDGDGVTDVAVRRNGSPAWSVDLGALRWIMVGLGAPVRLRPLAAA